MRGERTLPEQSMLVWATCQVSFHILFCGELLKATSAFAISFRGMEVAKLLTENFIKNQETPPAGNV